MEDRIDSQDERLLNLETSMRDVAYKTGQIEVKQDHLLDRLESGFKALSENHKELTDKHSKLEERLTPVERRHLAADARIQLAKKLILPAAIAMAGVFGARFGNQILDSVLRFFGV